jgi:hypothetical protein
MKKNFLNNLSETSKTIIVSLYRKLNFKSKIASWSFAQYFYVFSFIPISILTLISLILLIEGQLFHILGDTRCDINTFRIQDQYCNSYFGLMLGISIIAMLQMYLYWHYVTSVKNRFFPTLR